MVFQNRKDVALYFGWVTALSAIAFTAVFLGRAAITDDLATSVLAAEAHAAGHVVVTQQGEEAALLCPTDGGDDVRVGRVDGQGAHFPGYTLDARQRAQLAAVCAQALATKPL